MGDSFRVRPATEADLQAIHRVYNDAIRETTATWDEEPWTLAARVAWWREHAADPTCPVIAAEVGGVCAGFAYLSWYRRKSGYRFTREDTLYVAPPFQGQGLGRALLTALVGEARRLDLHTLVAVVEASNTASLALHQALGFATVGTEREIGFKFGRWLDATTLQLLLAEGD